MNTHTKLKFFLLNVFLIKVRSEKVVTSVDLIFFTFYIFAFSLSQWSQTQFLQGHSSHSSAEFSSTSHLLEVSSDPENLDYLLQVCYRVGA